MAAPLPQLSTLPSSIYPPSSYPSPEYFESTSLFYPAILIPARRTNEIQTKLKGLVFKEAKRKSVYPPEEGLDYTVEEVANGYDPKKERKLVLTRHGPADTCSGESEVEAAQHDKVFQDPILKSLIGSSSDVASSFQLLPVRYRDCVRNEGPCFFTINSNGVIGRVAKKHLGGLSGMNFFSDRGIKANNRAFVTKNHPSRIIYYKKPSYPSEVKLSKNKRFYVGWKLKSVNTAPFPMLTRNNFPGFFEFPSALATSKPKDNYVVLKGSAKD